MSLAYFYPHFCMLDIAILMQVSPSGKRMLLLPCKG